MTDRSRPCVRFALIAYGDVIHHHHPEDRSIGLGGWHSRSSWCWRRTCMHPLVYYGRTTDLIPVYSQYGALLPFYRLGVKILAFSWIDHRFPQLPVLLGNQSTINNNSRDQKRERWALATPFLYYIYTRAEPTPQPASNPGLDHEKERMLSSVTSGPVYTCMPVGGAVGAAS